VPALVAYPVFFHGQPVLVHAEIAMVDQAPWALYGDQRLRLIGTAEPGGEGSRLHEIRGTFWDVGRLEPTDPRLRDHDIERLSQSLFGKDWPGIGELPILIVESVQPVETAGAPGLRTIALDPARYRDERVTIGGRFRGRNLFGDQPQAPGRSRWDFVLQAGDSAIWVTGLQPRGRGFNLNLDARLDSSNWLEATGIVREGKGLVWIEATELVLGKAQETPEPEAAAPPASLGPPPRVLFSAPIQDETDVEPTTTVRIQFSRDMDPASFKSRIRVAYGGPASPGGDAPAPSFAITYNEGNRVLGIRFAAPLEQLRVVEVELGDGVKGIDGQMLPAWRLTFTTGR
jgi:hypothetical protein